jgi:hypothetical protein
LEEEKKRKKEKKRMEEKETTASCFFFFGFWKIQRLSIFPFFSLVQTATNHQIGLALFAASRAALLLPANHGTNMEMHRAYLSRVNAD